MHRLIGTGHQWRRTALAVGAVGALNANHKSSKCIGSDERSGVGGDASLSSVRARMAASRRICHCDSAAFVPGDIPSPAAELQTRGERLTQRKNPSRSASPNKPAFNLEQAYDIIRVLGEGAYGMVYHAKNKANGKTVALKAMPREFTGQTDFEREVAALQLLSKEKKHHENNALNLDAADAATIAGQQRIARLYDLHRDDENYYLAMELVEGGELFDHLIAGGPFSERLAASFLRQFAEGISYTHSVGLVHADLKPENLLLTAKATDENGGKEETSLKLVDFGCACTHDTSKKDLHLPAQEFAVGCSFLHMVALGNQFELQRMLMEKPSLVNFRDYDFRTPLHLAASEGHVDICRFLVAKGAKINRTDRWGGSPLDDAHRHKHAEVFKYLREQGAKFGNAATHIGKLIESAGAGNVEEVKALLEFGTAIDINQGDYDQRTALHLACSEGRLKMVELLVSQEGVDVDVEDRWGNRPLDDAKHAKQNSAEIAKLLKAQGAKAEKKFWPFTTSSQGKKSSSNSKDEDTQASSGTTFYWPPEMFAKGASPTPAIDMWAAGVIMYMVLTGTHPFDKFADKTDDEIKELMVKVGSSDNDGCNQNLMDEVVFDERVDGLSDSCIELMRQLMHPDPEQRMTSEDFLRHSWIQGITASWGQMDKAYKRHLQRVFKRSIANHFSSNANDDKVKLREVFNSIDIAGNGVLDANEIRIILRSAGEDEDAITKIVASLNFQRHGGKVRGVSFDEFERIMHEDT